MTSIDADIPPLLPECERPIRVILVDDHTILREGLRALLELESDLVIVGEYDCAETSLDGIRQMQPDVVLLDLGLPNGSGVQLTHDIRRLSPKSRKLVLTANGGAECIRATLCAGVDGYVLKDASRAELLHAIRTVSIGQRFLCKASASKVLSGFLRPDIPASAPHSPGSITVREREVLTRIAHGYSNKMIARDLGLSPKTVAKHRANLMRKLQLHNTAAVTMYAIRNGLADPPHAFAVPLARAQA